MPSYPLFHNFSENKPFQNSSPPLFARYRSKGYQKQLIKRTLPIELYNYQYNFLISGTSELWYKGRSTVSTTH